MSYVGLISCGETAEQSDSGRVVCLHDALFAANLRLATWEDREYWLGK
jgi:hypothetical protein